MFPFPHKEFFYKTYREKASILNTLPFGIFVLEFEMTYIVIVFVVPLQNLYVCNLQLHFVGSIWQNKLTVKHK